MVNYRPLGKTELEVSEIGFGTWTLTSGLWRSFTPDQAVELLHHAYDTGINYFETSDVHAGGLGETLLAMAFKEKRDLVVLSTKVGYRARGGAKDFSPEHIRRAVDGSLARLDTSYIDIVQLHHPDMGAVTTEAMWGALEDLRSEGKIRYYGIALGPGEGYLDEGRVAMRKRDLGCIEVYYNILEQEPSRRFFPVALEINQGMVIRGPHAGGVLESNPAEATAFPADEDLAVKDAEFVEKARKRAESLRWIYERKGMTLSQAALKFILSEETVASVFPNIYRPEQIDAYAVVSDFQGFSQAELGEIAEQFRKGFGVP